jgi:hypothetical protein
VKRTSGDNDGWEAATARSYESLASVGRTFTLYVFLAGHPWNAQREVKGPITAEPTSYPGSMRPWEEQEAIQVFLAPDITDEEQVAPLLYFLASDLVSIDALADQGSSLPEEVGRVRTTEEEPGALAFETSRHPGSFHFLNLRSGDWRRHSRDYFPRASQADAERLYLAVLAHTALRSDVLITTDEHMLENRFRQPLLRRAGIHTPAEGVRTVHLFLRHLLDRFPVATLRGANWFMDNLQFYMSVTRAHLPITLSAMRSSLSPQMRDSQLQVAEHLESSLARYANLLVATDELGWINQSEGTREPTNSSLVKQMYHLQYALVLASGILDGLAWVVALLAGSRPHRREVSWRKLVDDRPPAWVRRLPTRARDFVDEARTHPTRAILDFAYQLRDAVQHRQTLRAGVAEFHDDHGISEMSFSVMDPAASLPGDFSLPHAIPGSFLHENRLYLLPYQFVTHLRASLAHHLESVLGVYAWPQADWWRAESPWHDQAQLDLTLDERAASLY